MTITVHRLNNPVEGEASDCACGVHFDAVTLDDWRAHCKGDVNIVVPDNALTTGHPTPSEINRLINETL